MVSFGVKRYGFQRILFRLLTVSSAYSLVCKSSSAQVT